MDHWVERVSRSKGTKFWYNTLTKESSWVKPAGVIAAVDDDSSSATAVARHYDRRPAVIELTRDRSPTFNFRQIQNMFKRALMDRVARDYTNLSVLDIGCGQGGDLSKWSNVLCKHYTGVDISEESIGHARARYEALREKSVKYYEPCMPNAQFFACDIRDFEPPEGARYDIVSAMFSLHYIVLTDGFKDFVNRLHARRAVHSKTKWLIYVPNVKYRARCSALFGHVKFDHELESPTTVVTITDCVDRCEEPKVSFVDDIVPIMYSLGFTNKAHGSAHELLDTLRDPPVAEELKACELFHWGIFEANFRDPLEGSPTEPVVWFDCTEEESSIRVFSTAYIGGRA